MVFHPKEFKYSSYHYYAYGKRDPLIDRAPVYEKMGRTDEERRASYRGMVEDILKDDWKPKQPYSSVAFIGDPDWVERMSRQLRQVCREQDREALRRYITKFGDPSTS